MKKPTDNDRKEIQRLILEKLLMDRCWGMNYTALENIPKGLPKAYPTGWYYQEIKQLARERFLLPYKKGKCYRLNIEVKSQIEAIVGRKVPPKYD